MEHCGGHSEGNASAAIAASAATAGTAANAASTNAADVPTATMLAPRRGMKQYEAGMQRV